MEIHHMGFALYMGWNYISGFLVIPGSDFGLGYIYKINGQQCSVLVNKIGVPNALDNMEMLWMAHSSLILRHVTFIIPVR